MKLVRSGWAWAVVALVMVGCAGRPEPVAPPPLRPTAEPSPSSEMQPTPTPSPPATTAPEPFAKSEVARPTVRVLLSGSGTTVELPQPGRRYRVVGTDTDVWVVGPVVATVAIRDLWQVGAWQRRWSARQAVERLQEALETEATVWEEPSPRGLMRVRVRWWGDAPADPRARLRDIGYPDAQALPDRVLRLENAGRVVVSREEVVLEPEGKWPVAVGERRYRGRLRLRPGNAGVAVINELNMEQYLRGVVPREMGPSVFPELDALKAQAVAARTYTVAHLGDHEDEGYDLCDTPACQVYGGYDAEHGLTDRAVAETAGLIAVWDGRPIDAMYTSTCAGHTEAAADVFPDRAQPYLRGVPCRWDRTLELTGRSEGRRWIGEGVFRGEIVRDVLGLPPSPAPETTVGALAPVCGGVVTEIGDSAEELAAALAAAAGLEQSIALERGGSAHGGLLLLADRHRVALGPAGGARGQWALEVAAAALQLTGLLENDRGEAVPHPDGPGIYPAGADGSEPLPTRAALYERWQRWYRPVGTAVVFPGTLLERYRFGERTVAVVVVRSGGGGAADRRSRWTWWARERTWPELEGMLGVPDLDRIEITRRTPTGRVVGLVAVGKSGTLKEWSGFEVRLALGLPEMAFTLHVRGQGEERVARFLGRGWGHGVGLCQNGSYGLARAGMTFDRILEHYYPGVAVQRWKPLPAETNEGRGD